MRKGDGALTLNDKACVFNEEPLCAHADWICSIDSSSKTASIILT